MEITKFKKGEVLYHIRHDLRELPNEKSYGNESINPDLTKGNYSLVDHGKTAAEVRQYQHDLMKEIHAYNRKNIIYACELVVQCPSDCAPEQEKEFFQAAYDYFVSTLPMGEKCVLSAVVHTDEKHYTPDGEMISKNHLHLLYIPAVPESKHEGYEYKLCAHDLTSLSYMRRLHPGMQRYLNEQGIHATVYTKKEGSGRNVSLSVKQLKEITAQTGITFDHSLSVEELTKILNTNQLREYQRDVLKSQLDEKEQEIAHLSQEISKKDQAVDLLKTAGKEISAQREKIAAKDQEIKQLKTSLQEKEHELQLSQQRADEIEKENQVLKGRLQERDREIDKKREEEFLW